MSSEEIQAILQNEDFFDNSDFELSDDDDVADKIYQPPHEDASEDEIENDTTGDVEESYESDNNNNNQSHRDIQSRTFWKIDDFQVESSSTFKATQENVIGVQRSMDYFEKYITHDIISIMTTCTNQKVLLTGKNLRLTECELRKFIGMNLLMSIIKFPWIKLYWDRNYGYAAISSVMTRDRFFSIRNNLKVVDDNLIPQNERLKDKLWKVRPLLDSVRKRCLELPRSQNASVDEQMIPFTGSTELKQYVPNKPTPVGLKNWVVASTNGLVLDFEVSQGKNHLLSILTRLDNESQIGFGEAVVLRLCQTLHPGTCLYFDRFFTTLNLLDRLSSLQMYGTGTIQKNRIPKPCSSKIDEKSFQKKPRGNSISVVRQDSSKPPLAITAWLDNKVIYMASNHEGIPDEDECKRWSKKDKKYVTVSRPLIVKNYNNNMGGIDVCDQMISYYRMGSKTKKWTVRTLMHFIDLSCANSWREYIIDCKKNERPPKDTKKYLEFKLDIAENLLNSINQISSSEDEENSVTRSRVTPLPNPAKRKKAADHLPIIFPSSEPYHRCRLPHCSKFSRTYYEKCEVYLCLNTSRNCFSKFHK